MNTIKSKNLFLPAINCLKKNSRIMPIETIWVYQYLQFIIWGPFCSKFVNSSLTIQHDCSNRLNSHPAIVVQLGAIYLHLTSPKTLLSKLAVKKALNPGGLNLKHCSMGFNLGKINAHSSIDASALCYLRWAVSPNFCRRIASDPLLVSSQEFNIKDCLDNKWRM